MGELELALEEHEEGGAAGGRRNPMVGYPRQASGLTTDAAPWRGDKQAEHVPLHHPHAATSLIHLAAPATAHTCPSPSFSRVLPRQAGPRTRV